MQSTTVQARPDRPWLAWPSVRRRALAFDRTLQRGEYVICGICVVLMFILVIMQVVSRHLMSVPLFWLEEIARFSLVWASFISAALATGLGINLIVTFLSDRLGRTASAWLSRAGEGVIIASSLALLPACLTLTEKMSRVTGGASGLPRSVLFAAPLVGLSLMVVHAAINLLFKQHPFDDSVMTE